MIKAGIYGYGNVGRGVECALAQAEDFETVGVFTRRDPATVKTLTGIPAYDANRVSDFARDLDVLILCGGSATDLPVITPALAASFNVVDSFDTHAKIPEHFANVDAAAQKGGKTAVISGGWDPGLFSLARVYAQSVIPDGGSVTFWGRGVSQGHSDAVRRIPGVLDARQYTVPVPEAVARVKAGEIPPFTAREKHTRECYVVAAPEADKQAIEQAIKTMPNYFADYDTTVTFISMEELREKHMGIPHGGSVIRTGKTGMNLSTHHTIEYSLKLESNPEFTGSVLTAFARAAFRLSAKGECGCKTVFDIAPAMLMPVDGAELRAHML